MGTLAAPAFPGGGSLVAAIPSWSECSPSSDGSPLPLARASWGGDQPRSVRGVAGRTEEPFVGLQLPRSPPPTAAGVSTSGSLPQPVVCPSSYPQPRVCGVAGRTEEPFVGPRQPRAPPPTAVSVPTFGPPPQPGVRLGSYPQPRGWPPSDRNDRVAAGGWSPPLRRAPTAARPTRRLDPLVPLSLPSRPPAPAGVSACQAAEPLHSSQPPSRDPAGSPVFRSLRLGALSASGPPLLWRPLEVSASSGSTGHGTGILGPLRGTGT